SGVLNNLTGAVYDLAGDGDFRWESGTRGVINNDGVFRKSAGTGVSTMSGGGSAISFNNGAGGVIDVQSGELRLDGPGSSVGGTFLVALNAVLNLNGDFEFSGTYTGSGAGHVQLTGRIQGADAVFDFAPGVFQWTSGTLGGAV